MKNLTHWFNRPAFARSDSNTPKKNESEPTPEPSPLTEPPTSFVFNDLSPQSANDAEAQLKAAIHLSTQEDILRPHAWNQSFQSVESGSFGGSQRIIKNGKEIVISSDGEDTDSIGSLEDPDNFFASSSKTKDESAPTKVKKITSPKKWKYDINTLVTIAVDDNEVEAKVASSRTNLGLPQGNGHTGGRLNESTLVSALGEDEDASKVRRTMDAVRRTEALNHERNWFFFDGTQPLPPGPDFPQDLRAPGNIMELLKGPFFIIQLFCRC
jgi:hypothetical protein